ncbi:CBS domain-containing protein [Pseudonocardia sp. RS11V-5]|uniref:CBS domain-containing protein n=1 Tax=Pseudonocardia terrae TaxID=2905831 RepID=UPI001E28DA9D|nr:CBS domain-containing protein [Pseudonocardia terrae]MCE3553139.1 CBS domain-containing protein [Pseudonocardia terrae]
MTPMRRTLVADVMTTDVEAVSPDAPVAEVVAALRRRGVRALPVVDGEHLLGVVSEADVLRLVEHDDVEPPVYHRRRRWRQRSEIHPHTRARDLMTTDVVAVAPDAGVAEAARVMAEHRLGWLPVVDGPTGNLEGRLVRLCGVLGRSDLLEVFERPDDDMIREVREEVLGRILLIDPGRVDVTASGGVVELKGRVPTHADAVVAVALTRRLEGVVDVVDRLTHDVDERTVDVKSL